MNTRLMGTILAITTIMVILADFRANALGIDPATSSDPVTGTAYALWGVGGICGILGLIRLNALGPSPVARALGFLPLLGFATFVLGNALFALGLLPTEGPLFMGIVSFGWITVLAGMLIVGILTIAAKTWTGWRRFLPLLTIVIFVVTGAIGLAVGNTNVGGLVSNLAWILLGYVIATAEPGFNLQQSATS